MLPKAVITIALATMAWIPTSYAERYGNDSEYYDYARVVDVRPLMERVREPIERRECWDQEVEHRSRDGDGVASTLLGGAVGGAIGSRFGRGTGRDVATVAGALLGGSVGNELYAKGDHPPRVSVEERCRTVTEYEEREQIRGYRVTYRYKGETFTTRMDHDPGDRVRVGIDVRPAE